MRTLPSESDFEAAYRAGRPQVCWTRLVADLETPVSAFLKLSGGRPFSCLFESVEGGSTIGRYSFLAFKPDLIWRCRDGAAEINRQPRLDPGAFEAEDLPPLESLRRLIHGARIELPPELPPMAACLIGYMAYDAVRLMERIPDSNPEVVGLPESLYMRPSVIAVFDRVEDSMTVVTPVWPEPGIDAAAAHRLARERLAECVADLGRNLPYRRERPEVVAEGAEPVSNMAPADYMAMVERAKEYIRAGDAFQIVPSQRFAVPFGLPPFALYRSLRRLNPSPFLFFLDLGEAAIVGSSPEILVRVRDGRVTIRPLAGTRPRGKDAAEDERLKADLLADPKELAEHLMLLDLGRNDVGRVSKIGTVEVTVRNAVELYSHVMHISSTVEGELADGLEALDALIAGFPAGTVSGAPKVRAMEIIDELEPERRGVYSGTVGYFGAGGSMDTCIALRTGVVKDGTLYVQAGAGVVADSEPATEHQECVNKARALIRAAEDALAFAAEG